MSLYPSIFAPLPFSRCIESVCLCVCVFFPFILDIKFVGRISRGHTGGRSHRVSHPPSFCGACLNFSREKDSAIPCPLDREVEFCVLTIYSFSTCWAFLFFIFLYRDSNSRSIVSEGYEFTSELPGRPAVSRTFPPLSTLVTTG